MLFLIVGLMKWVFEVLFSLSLLLREMSLHSGTTGVAYSSIRQEMSLVVFRRFAAVPLSLASFALVVMVNILKTRTKQR
jgi:hypothetical protein